MMNLSHGIVKKGCDSVAIVDRKDAKPTMVIATQNPNDHSPSHDENNSSDNSERVLPVARAPGQRPSPGVHENQSTDPF